MSNTIRPHIGSSTARTTQARAVRTREAIVSAAAKHFDTGGYGASSINTITHTAKFAKGAMYYHFPSKEAIAEHLISDWNHTLDETITDTVAGSSSTAAEKLTTIFTSLAHQITENTNLRAGMKLTLEPTIDNAAGFAHWVGAISDIIETAITDGELPDTPHHTPTGMEPMRRHRRGSPRIRDYERRHRPRNPRRRRGHSAPAQREYLSLTHVQNR